MTFRRAGGMDIAYQLRVRKIIYIALVILAKNYYRRREMILWVQYMDFNYVYVSQIVHLNFPFSDTLTSE
jgi:hypothetical protein